MTNDQLLARLSDLIEDKLLTTYYQQQERDYDEMVNEEPPYKEDN